jgi:hypothetical protein
MARSHNFAGNIVITAFTLADTEFTIPHGLGYAPSGFVVLGQSAPGRLYRPFETVGGLNLAANLVGGWEFENAGNLGLDSGPNALGLTNNNIVTQASGKVGFSSSYVRASTQFLSRASEALLQTGDISFTVAAWVNLASKPAGSFMMIGSKSNAGAQEFYLAYTTAADRFQAAVFKPAGVTVNSNTFGAPGTGTFYLVLMWHDAAADTLNIQVNNGGVDSQATGGALAAAGAAEFRIGGWQNSALYWDGQIDQVMFWKRVLAAADRTALYNAGAGITVATALVSGTYQPKPWNATNAILKSTTATTTYRLLFF